MIEFPEFNEMKEEKSLNSLEFDFRGYSNNELLRILIGTESTNVLMSVGNSLCKLGSKNVYDLMKIKGIGLKKAQRIMATIELGKRRQAEPAQVKKSIKRSSEIFEYFYPLLADLHHEEFWLLLLNRSNSIIGSSKISVGGVAGVVVDPKIVFRVAIEFRASGIVLCHNHPSGSLKPSIQDDQLTRKLREAGNTLDIIVVDHVIISGNFYFSFSDEGLMH